VYEGSRTGLPKRAQRHERDRYRLESAKRVLLDTVIEIGRAYAALNDGDKADFRAELDLSLSQAQRYRVIGERYLDRVRMLSGRHTSATPLIERFRRAGGVA